MLHSRHNMFLDIINRIVFIQNNVLCIFQNNVSETRLCLHLQVKPNLLGQSIDLVPISGRLCQFQDEVRKPNITQIIYES
jgi:hypothetical protein